MDKRVIDIPFMGRWVLVNLIIAPFRAPKSAKEYRKLFTERGSPLKFYTEDLVGLLQKELGEDFIVDFAMRYQRPSIEAGLERLRKYEVRKIHVIPLFPQYASATTGSVHEKVMKIMGRWQILPEIVFTSQFHDHKLFIEALASQGRKLMDQTDYDHFVFSYHGLPERQIMKGSNGDYCRLGDCCYSYTASNRFCYRAQCFETTRLVTDLLRIPPDRFTVCFQSRLGRSEWIKPYTEDVIKDLAMNGSKKVLAFSPAFVSDCLETTIEVGETYREKFLKAGGERWDLVPGLNTEEKWVQCLKEIILN